MLSAVNLTGLSNQYLGIKMERHTGDRKKLSLATPVVSMSTIEEVYRTSGMHLQPLNWRSDKDRPN
jgi:hypothetical protein